MRLSERKRLRATEDHWRDFYLAPYDVAGPRRLGAALALVRGYATGGQKSVHEIFLTSAERHELLNSMARLLDKEADRFFLLRPDPRARTYAHSWRHIYSFGNRHNAGQASSCDRTVPGSAPVICVQLSCNNFTMPASVRLLALRARTGTMYIFMYISEQDNE